MAKAIKFNLPLNKKPVRDLEDLRENFNIDDLLEAYHGGLLQRWLEVQGLIEEKTKLERIFSVDNIDKNNHEIHIAKELCKIFKLDFDSQGIEAAIYPFIFRKNNADRLDKLQKADFKTKEVIKNYHAGYENLCAEMEKQSDNYAFLKPAVAEMWRDYNGLLFMDFDRFLRHCLLNILLYFFRCWRIAIFGIIVYLMIKRKTRCLN